MKNNAVWRFCAGKPHKACAHYTPGSFGKNPHKGEFYLYKNRFIKRWAISFAVLLAVCIAPLGAFAANNTAAAGQTVTAASIFKKSSRSKAVKSTSGQSASSSIGQQGTPAYNGAGQANNGQFWHRPCWQQPGYWCENPQENCPYNGQCPVHSSQNSQNNTPAPNQYGAQQYGYGYGYGHHGGGHGHCR